MDELLLPLFKAQYTGAIEHRFQAFHADNPHVYRALVRMAREWKLAGHQRLGIKALFERLRWEYGMRTASTDFKLNNNFTSHYARLIAENEPDLAELFELRELRAA